MSRRLLLIRHAKSSWDYPNLDDHERPLATKGREAAPLMAQQHKTLIRSIEHFYCSTAVRAKHTLQLLLGSSSFSPSLVTYSDAWYSFDARQVLKYIQSIPDNLNQVAIVGHNPALTELINHLCGVDVGNLPTTGMALIKLNCESWQSMAHAKGKLLLFVSPKSYTQVQ